MRVSGLDSAGDWRFGKGKAVYLTKSAAIQQNVVTRLKSFTDDWFADMSDGVPWFDLLGERSTDRQLLREVEKTVLQTFGVRSIDRLRLANTGADRIATLEITITDIFNETFTNTVQINGS